MKAATLSVVFVSLWCYGAVMVSAQTTPHGQTRVRLVQQLGSPVSIDEAALGADNVLRWSGVTNRSDRTIKAVSIGYFVCSTNGQIQVDVISTIRFDEALGSGASTRLSRQAVQNKSGKPIREIVLFVARAEYDDGNEYVADTAAMRSELFGPTALSRAATTASR